MWDAGSWKEKRWLVVGRLSGALLFLAFGFVASGSTRWPLGVWGAGVSALLAWAVTVWVPRGRPQGWVNWADLAWITLGVISLGTIDSGITLLFALSAFIAGTSLGARHALAHTTSCTVVLGIYGLGMGLWGINAPGIAAQMMLTLVLGYLGHKTRKSIETRDVALRSASKALERLRLSTDMIIENLGSGILSVDGSGRVVHLNYRAQRMLGIQKTDSGEPLREILPEGAATLIEELENALASGKSVQRKRVVIEGADGPIPLGVGTTVLRSKENEVSGVVALFQDLTAVEKEMKAERRKDRLAAIGELAAGIAHEIRNSILPVSGSVQILAQELEPKGEQAKLFDVIERETDNIQHFVTSLLTYASSRPLALVELSLQDLVKRAQEDLALARRKSVTIEYEGEDVLVWGDLHQLQQVLRNLMSNAVDAAGSGGKVVVRTYLRKEGPCFEVEDTGTGVPPEDRERIFDPFVTAKAGGTGLGLPIAQRIMEDHGGAITVEQGMSGGALFRATLPKDIEQQDSAA